MSDPTPPEPENLTLEILREMRQEIREMRQEMTAFQRENVLAQGQLQSLVMATFDRTKRLERRLEEVRDDLETTIKMEIMGSLANFRTEMERRLDSLPGPS